MSDAVRLEVDVLRDRRPGPAADAAEADGEGLTLLVVDDDADMRGYVRGCVISHGGPIRHIEEAADGQRALERLRAGGIDLVVCDVVTPGPVDGLALCRAIRDDLALRSLPVLVVTGELTGRDAARRARSAGADAVLTKPFNATRLCARIEDLLRLRGPP